MNVPTYDEHQDKVWALAVGKKTEMLATGGGDAVINLWHDSTAAEKEEAFRKEEEVILRGQELENAVLDADYVKAIRLAFELRRPHKLFELLSDLCRKIEAEDQVSKALQELDKDEISKLLEYIREWNTKPKLCHVSQLVLSQLFTMLSPTEIVKIKGIGELLEGLIPYSQRHFSRIDRLERSTFLLDYALVGMSVMEPQTNGRETGTEENGVVEETIIEEPAVKSSKKRKPKDSAKASSKKVKKTAKMEAKAAIELQA